MNRQTIYLQVAQPKAIVQLKQAGTLHAEVQAYIDKELSVLCQLMDLCTDDLGYVRETDGCHYQAILRVLKCAGAAMQRCAGSWPITQQRAPVL